MKPLISPLIDLAIEMETYLTERTIDFKKVRAFKYVCVLGGCDVSLVPFITQVEEEEGGWGIRPL